MAIPTPDTIDCPTCEGTGDVQHPLWGRRACPDPTITCPTCGGSGEVPEDYDEGEDPRIAAAEWEGI